MIRGRGLCDSLDPAKLPPQLAEKQRYLAPLAVECFKRALRSGLKVAFGTDAGVFPHGDTPLNAIQSATIVNAELLGTPDRGRIEPGLLANLIAVAGNPLEGVKLLEDMRFGMQGGIVYKAP